MNLLIVDDEVIEVDLIEKMVRGIGLEFQHIYKAYYIKEAIEILKKNMVSIVICDIEMPGGSGHDLTEWIRERCMEIEVIFLTGHAEFDYAAMALRLGASDYLLKPVKKEKLKRALLKAMSKIPEKNNSGIIDAEIIVNQVKDYIRRHCEETLNRDALARQYFITPNYLSRIFRDYSSMSLQDYIIFVRIEKAKELLIYSNYTVSEIALRTGYSNTAYFIKHFKREMNMTPIQYRKQENDE